MESILIFTIFEERISLQELIGLLGVFEGSLLANPENPDPKADKYIQAIDMIYDIIDRKAENDNCKIILITDYVD
jgi:hypothetical protein